MTKREIQKVLNAYRRDVRRWEKHLREVTPKAMKRGVREAKRKDPEGFRKKLSERWPNGHPWIGKKHTEETKRKMSESQKAWRAKKKGRNEDA